MNVIKEETPTQTEILPDEVTDVFLDCLTGEVIDLYLLDPKKQQKRVQDLHNIVEGYLFAISGDYRSNVAQLQNYGLPWVDCLGVKSDLVEVLTKYLSNPTEILTLPPDPLQEIFYIAGILDEVARHYSNIQSITTPSKLFFGDTELSMGIREVGRRMRYTEESVMLLFCTYLVQDRKYENTK